MSLKIESNMFHKPPCLDQRTYEEKNFTDYEIRRNKNVIGSPEFKCLLTSSDYIHIIVAIKLSL